ncbi:hypothetical protein QO002_005440 [Pararhizobium capsulatum DSM 1112]|uniref:Uncharacterized protein n=1 Tax=Pararhizobium capsulatum DSM 1112 TaxID=1121113 RepID=A0ABU0BY94_9HYPH|nr:hypothetical protein [Pararhizobium capsulatum DSM 1112]
MRQQAFDGTSSGVRVKNSIALDDGSPSFVERGRVVSRVDAGGLHRFDEQGSGVFGAAKQDTTMTVDKGIEIFVEVEQVRQDQLKRFLSKEG